MVKRRYIQKGIEYGKRALSYLGFISPPVAFYYGSKAIDIASNAERAKELTRWYSDWQRNVGSQGRYIQYPLLSALGGLPNATSGVLKDLNNVYHVSKKTSKFI